MSDRNLNVIPKSLLVALKEIDYSPWERVPVNQRAKFRLSFLPSIPLKQRRESNRKSIPKLKEDRMVLTTGMKSAQIFRQRPAWQRGLTREMVRVRSLENVRTLQRLCKNKKASLEELKQHSKLLLERNWELLQSIREMDNDSNRQARSLLQQYNMLGTVITTLRDSSQNQVGKAKADLEAVENMVEKNSAKLDLEVKRTTAKVHALHEELNVLRTYMDKEHPLKAVQIASLKRSIRKQNAEEEYELEDTEDLARRFLTTLVRKTREEEEHILQAVVDKMLSEYQGGLSQMHRNNNELTRQIEIQKRASQSGAGRKRTCTRAHRSVGRSWSLWPSGFHNMFLLARNICHR